MPRVLEHAVEESVYAGAAMNRRAVYMYGAELGKTPEGQIGAGLGMTTSTGTVSLIPATVDITHTGQRETVDGVLMEFQLTLGTKAPAEMSVLFPDRRALRMAENATHNLHDQSLRMVNQGYTGLEIAELIELPPALERAWHARGYYGSVSRDVKAIYQWYMGGFDGNPASLWKHLPEAAARRYVDCLGGTDAVVARARQYAESGDLRFAAELLNHAVFAHPAHEKAKQLTIDWNFTDENTRHRMTLSNGALIHWANPAPAGADFIAALAALLGVPVFDTLPGLFTGIADSLLLLYRVSRPHIAVLGQVPGSDGRWADVAGNPGDRTVPGATLHHAASDDHASVIVLDCETIPFLDVTAARMLNQLTAEMKRRGVRLVVARDIGQVRDMLAMADQASGAPQYFGSVQEAANAVRPGSSGMSGTED